MLRVASALLCALIATQAHAVPGRVAVARVTVIGNDVSAELQRSLQGSLAGGILAAGVTVVPDEELARALHVMERRWPKTRTAARSRSCSSRLTANIELRSLAL